MAKVIFEFDDSTEGEDVQLVVNRYRMLHTLHELSNFRRELYKGYDNTDTIVVKDNRVVMRDDKKLEDYDLEGTKLYIYDDKIINRLDDILTDVNDILN